MSHHIDNAGQLLAQHFEDPSQSGHELGPG
jgi:hypothetical protein